MEKAKTREGWTNMSAENKKRFSNAYNMMFDDEEKRKYKYRMADDDARTEAGYFTKMNQSQKDIFDATQTRLNLDRDASDDKYMA